MHPQAIPQVFRDRAEAGRLLAERLRPGYGHDTSMVVLALPRGGVPVGYEISRALHLPLDVLITRKLGAPGNPEYAIGAVSESGHVHLNPEAWNVLAALQAPSSFLDASVRAQTAEIARRQKLYRQGRPLPDLRGRTVLLVDDGVATGATFLASVEALRALPLGRLVAALPVAPPATLQVIAGRVDDLIVLLTPEPFYAVGNHYLDFTQISDEQVTQCLAAAEVGRDGASVHP